MDVSKIKAMGWKAKISLEEGIRMVYAEYHEIVDRWPLTTLTGFVENSK